MSSPRHRHGRIPVLLLFVAGSTLASTAGASPGPGVFVPGHEADVIALFSPLDDETFTLGPWRLGDLRLGPECAIRMTFASGTTAATALLVPPRGAGGEPLPGISLSVEAPAGAGPSEDLRARLQAHLDREDRRAFFTPLCEFAASSSAPGTAGAAADRRALPIPWLRATAWFLLLLAAGAQLVRCRRGGGLDVPANPLPGPNEIRLRRLAWLLALLAAGLRLPLFWLAGPDNCETIPLLQGVRSLRLEFLVPESATAEDWHWLLHPPLHPAFVAAWARLGELFGVGGALPWLRLPNAAASAALVLLVARVGRSLRLPVAGLAAAALFALAPAPLRLGVMQENYLYEALLAAWFLERLVAIGVLGRPAWLGVASAAAGALLTGFMALPILVVGGAWLAWRLLRAGRVAVLLSMGAAVALAVAPPVLGLLLVRPWYQAEHVSEASLGSALPYLFAWFGPGLPVVALALGPLLPLAVARPRLGVFSAAVLAGYVALHLSTPARLCNFAAALPVLLLLPFAGLEALLADRSGRASRLAVSAVLLLLLLPAWLPLFASGRPVKRLLYATGYEGLVGTFVDQPALESALRAHLPPGAPLLVVVRDIRSFFFFYSLCGPYDAAASALACSRVERQSQPGLDAAIYRFPSHAAAVLVPDDPTRGPLPIGPDAPMPRLAALGSTPPFDRSPFLSIVAADAPPSWRAGLAAELQAGGLRCRPVDEPVMLGFELARCARDP